MVWPIFDGFQFQLGSIKVTVNRRLQVAANLRFNSSLVLLKLVRQKPVRGAVWRVSIPAWFLLKSAGKRNRFALLAFQFQLGSIKGTKMT